MAFYEKGDVRIRYEDTGGSGFPLLVIPGGGLNSSISNLTSTSPFNPMEVFKGEFRCIAADLRNATTGQSTGPIDIERPWDSHTDDQIGLMDHLGIEKFMVLGFCIGGPFAWNLLKRVPDRIAAAVLAQPVGHRPEMPGVHIEHSMKNWAPEIVKRPGVTMDTVVRYVNAMYADNPDFVITVSRDFVRACKTPILVMPDNIPSHPLAAALESAALAPNAEITMYPWKQPKERIALAVDHLRKFLHAHRA